MRREERWLLAVAVVVVDLVIVIVPLAALLAAFVLIARPPWFRAWLEELYRGE